MQCKNCGLLIEDKHGSYNVAGDYYYSLQSGCTNPEPLENPVTGKEHSNEDKLFNTLSANQKRNVGNKSKLQQEKDLKLLEVT